MTTAFLRPLAVGLTLFAAGPALAQDVCAGLSGGVWIGGDEAGSDIATAEAAQDQIALVLLGNDYVSLFSLSSPADVRLEAAATGNGDPLISLYNENGLEIGFDDDGGGGVDSRLETSLDAGRYCLTLGSFDGGGLTATVRIGRQDHEALTPGSALGGGGGGGGGGFGCEGAVALTDGPADGMLGDGLSATNAIGDVPAYSFTLSEPAAVTLTAQNENADPVLTLLNADGIALAENDDFDGLNSRIDMTAPLPAGEYCISLAALSDSFAPVTTTLSAYDPAAAQEALYDQGEVAPPLDGSYPVADLGTVSTRLRQDALMTPPKASWFSFTIDEPGLIVIEAIGTSGGDPILTLFDDLGREIAYNDDSGAGLDSLVAARVQAGSYVLSLRDLNDSGTLMRLVFERFVPAQ